jgi:hypothetical protein
MHGLEVQILPHDAELLVVVKLLIRDVDQVSSRKHPVVDESGLAHQIHDIHAAIGDRLVEFHNEPQKVVSIFNVDGQVHVADWSGSLLCNGPHAARQRAPVAVVAPDSARR